ncbi:hypothetical protein [Roseobacter sp. HKCCA0434]|uniref:hypothetical protein n=1 Tax=Roseobacter sp. HKCCA0434 TaxID=3079297 RepID=UPI002905D187|nr:hypothetical protein [Roseobacter sp. HKCCA0434]
MLTFLASCLPLAPALGQHDCEPPQLDTKSGCIWPEQLGLVIREGEPLVGSAILRIVPPETLGRDPVDGATYYRVASSNLVLLLEGPQLIVREIFYDDDH